jgi:GNAT superfamily N-acetyltransferase
VLVAVDDGDVVGVCQVLIFQHFQHAGGWCCEIESVHVRADRRSQGIGGALLDTAEAFAHERGCYRIQLTSNIVRSDAHRFYVAHGYSATHQGFKKFFSS